MISCMPVFKTVIGLTVACVFNGLLIGILAFVWIGISQQIGSMGGIVVCALFIWKSPYFFYYPLKIFSAIAVMLLYKIEVKNKAILRAELHKSEPCILAPTHCTFVDGVFIFHLLPWWKPRPVAFAAWYTYYIGLLPYMWLLGVIPMANKKNGKVTGILRYANRKIEKALLHKKSLVCVFPEGMLNPDGKTLCPIKKGIPHWVRSMKEKGHDIKVLPIGLVVKNSFFSRNFNGKLQIKKPVEICIGEPIRKNCTVEVLAARLSELTGLPIHPA